MLGEGARRLRLGLDDAKRLDRGKFIWPSASSGAVSISAAQIAYMLEGIDWRNPQLTWRLGLAHRARRWRYNGAVTDGRPVVESDDAVSMRPLYATWQQHAMLEYVYQFVIAW